MATLFKILLNLLLKKYLNEQDGARNVKRTRMFSVDRDVIQHAGDSVA